MSKDDAGVWHNTRSVEVYLPWSDTIILLTMLKQCKQCCLVFQNQKIFDLKEVFLEFDKEGTVKQYNTDLSLHTLKTVHYLNYPEFRAIYERRCLKVTVM